MSICFQVMSSGRDQTVFLVDFMKIVVLYVLQINESFWEVEIKKCQMVGRTVSGRALVKLSTLL